MDAVAEKHWVSPTQESTYELCPRKWGFEKLDGIKRPPNKYAEIGTQIHSVIEDWLEDGVVIDGSTDIGKIVSPGIKFLPEPGVGLIENSFNMRTNTAIYTGKWDILIPKPRLYVGKTPIIEIYDHKTTGDLKWAKRFEELREDPQGVIYPVAALAVLRSAWLAYSDKDPGVCFNWVYYRRNAKRPGSKLVQMYILPDDEPEVPHKHPSVKEGYFGILRMSELESNFDKKEEIAAKLLNHHRLGHKAKDLPFNVAGCRALGGCPYRGASCVLTAKELMRGFMEQEESTVSRILKKTTDKETEGSGVSDAVAKMRAAKARKAASAEASPEAKEKSEEEIRASTQDDLPAVNPPESGREIPEEKQTQVPAQSRAAAEPIHEKWIDQLRVQSACTIAAGYVQTPLGVSAKEVARLSLETADAIISKVYK